MTTSADVAVTLGRPAPVQGSSEQQQWALWIGYAERAIKRRADQLGVEMSDLDAEDVAMVVRESVAAKIKQPDAVRRVDIGVDDGRVGKEYSSATGQVTITDAWWEILFPGQSSAAFSTRPAFEPDRRVAEPWL